MWDGIISVSQSRGVDMPGNCHIDDHLRVPKQKRGEQRRRDSKRQDMDGESSSSTDQIENQTWHVGSCTKLLEF